jgi:hypothetical protein
MNNGIMMMIPNGANMQATHTALWDIKQIPKGAQAAHTFPQRASHAIVSYVIWIPSNLASE